MSMFFQPAVLSRCLRFLFSICMQRLLLMSVGMSARRVPARASSARMSRDGRPGDVELAAHERRARI